VAIQRFFPRRSRILIRGLALPLLRQPDHPQMGVKMRIFTSSLLALTFVGLPNQSLAQVVDLKTQPAPPPAAAAPAKPLTTCEGLARDWRTAEVTLAKNDVEELADNSAPRATMRAIRDNNALQLASITLTLMSNNKCPLPKRAPSEVTYMLPAMECRTEQLKGNYKAPQCDYSTWKPLGQ
jgi:hypothetical protein